MGIQLSDRVENIVGKEEIAHYVTSNFFFSHNVFKNCLLLIHQNEYLWSKGLICCLTTGNAFYLNGAYKNLVVYKTLGNM